MFYIWKRFRKSPNISESLVGKVLYLRLRIRTALYHHLSCSEETILTVLGRHQHFPLPSLLSPSAPEQACCMVKAQEGLLMGMSANPNQIYHYEKGNNHQQINKNILRFHFPPSPCQSWKGSPVFEK